MLNISYPLKLILMPDSEIKDLSEETTISTSIAPWFSVQDSVRAVNFYKSAFGAVETYRLETPDGGVVAKLSVNGAEFWLSEDSRDNLGTLGGGSVRMILTVSNPDALFRQALEA